MASSDTVRRAAIEGTSSSWGGGVIGIFVTTQRNTTDVRPQQQDMPLCIWLTDVMC